MASTLHICHLTVLNPAIHSRIFYKEARSQAAAGHKVSIIGQSSAKAPFVREGVTIVPNGTFSRLSWARYRAPKRILKEAMALKADIYQIHTPELLGIGKVLKAAGAKVIYDVHEDYVANVSHGGYYPGYLQNFLVKKIKAAEQKFGEYGDGVIYAEECFRDIVPMAPAQVAYVLNKYQPPERQARKVEIPVANKPLMLYTGTIAENWGIFRALELWKALNHRYPVNMYVAGHTHDRTLMKRVKNYVSETGIDFRFSMIDGGDYVPFDYLVDLIHAASFGVAFYRLRPNIRDRIPTKFYEFMALRKPLLFTSNSPWNALNEAHGFGQAVDFPLDEATVDRLADMIAAPETHFFKQEIPESAYGWPGEASKLLSLIDRVAGH